MSAMTPERLEQIQFVLQAGFQIHPDTERVLAFELLAEVERLRAGIKAMAADNEDRSQRIWERRDRVHSVCDALLNPTEGETESHEDWPR